MPEVREYITRHRAYIDRSFHILVRNATLYLSAKSRSMWAIDRVPATPRSLAQAAIARGEEFLKAPIQHPSEPAPLPTSAASPLPAFQPAAPPILGMRPAPQPILGMQPAPQPAQPTSGMAASPCAMPPSLQPPQPPQAAAPGSAGYTEVGLFWDYENLAVPRGHDASEASNRLRTLSLRFGQLV